MADTVPTVRRRQLARVLKGLRERAGLDQDEVAAHLECDHSKVSRIETARSGVRPIDLRKMLALYDVTDDAQVEGYVQLAKDSRQRGWWVKYRGLHQTFSAFLGLEAETKELRTYETTFIPGLLQTEDYARALILGSARTAGADVEGFVEVRRQRQLVLDRATFTLWVVIGEAALLHAVASPAVRKGQLLHLIEQSTRSNVELQVLGLGSGLYSAAAAPFTHLTFDGDLPDVVYEDTATSGWFVEHDDDVAAYSHTFSRLIGGAMPPQESRDLIQAIAERL
jgi:transcriptional regulator with XRE-family HTH domain